MNVIGERRGVDLVRDNQKSEEKKYEELTPPAGNKSKDKEIETPQLNIFELLSRL